MYGLGSCPPGAGASPIRTNICYIFSSIVILFFYVRLQIIGSGTTSQFGVKFCTMVHPCLGCMFSKFRADNSWLSTCQAQKRQKNLNLGLISVISKMVNRSISHHGSLMLLLLLFVWHRPNYLLTSCYQHSYLLSIAFVLATFMSSPVHRRTSSIHAVLLFLGKHFSSISPSIVA